MAKLTIATKMKKTNLKSLSRFLQILDGSFPSGIFVHSFGLEPHIIKEKVVFKENREIKNQNFHTDKKDNSKAFERNNRDGQRDVNRNFQNI